MVIQPIETVYRGYRFRSRTEARWAVYFDVIGLKWIYEKEGYDLNGIWYLPDFWLSDVDMWAEVKPKEFKERELKKVEKLVELTGFSCILLDGLPEIRSYWTVDKEWTGKNVFYKDTGEDVMISMCKDYPINEHRFYQNTGYYETVKDNWDILGGMFEDIPRAVEISRSARFEHGETLDLESIKDILSKTKYLKW